MTYEELLKIVSKEAIKHNKEAEAIKLLLMELSPFDNHEFYMNIKTEVAPEFYDEFIAKTDLYIKKDIPIQHILGYAFFYGYRFIVNQDVLIPRIETEQLVENTLYYYDKYFENQEIRVLDLGTGSGCIGLTLKKEENKLDVTVSDVSNKALDIAKQNGDKLEVEITYNESSWFDNIKGQFDMIISNPPYIPDDEIVEKIVDKEPSLALYGGKTGTDFYYQILQNIKPYLKPYSLIGFEHGYQQKALIKTYVENFFPEAKIIQLQDFQGKDRFTFIGFGGVLKDE